MEWVQQQLAKDSSGHDYYHILRVVNTAQCIHRLEGGDEFLILMAAWLHDIGDYKMHNGQDRTQELVGEFLDSLLVLPESKMAILNIITQVSFKGGHNEPPTTIEAQIVQDADRLDAMGAIGIARCFAYGGSKG
ncbi:unnamed protein product, partial [Notodromas monacha]